MKKNGIIGHFGGNREFSDGQTVKTKNLKKIVEEHGGFDTYCVDTFLVRKHKLLLLLKSIICLVRCENIVILLSVNGMNFYLPFLYWTNKIFNRHIYHDIIGSELLEMVERNPKLVKYLNSFEVNWFEYESGASFLKKHGVENVEVLPNCKKLDALPLEQIVPYTPNDEKYVFCTFSRVMEEKGITDAINAISEINKNNKKNTVALDIYGPIENTYSKKFDKLLKEHSDCITYKGICKSESSVDVLKDYYALLFPTRWQGEGFPGTVLDCYASALPVLASNWNANKEIIIHTKTGIIYPSEIATDLRSAIAWSINNKDKMDDMRMICRKEYEKYTPEYISSVICSAMKSSTKKN